MKFNTKKIYKSSLNWGVVLLALSITFSITLMNIAFGLFILAFGIKVFKKDVRYIPTGVDIPLAIFLGFYLLSSLLSSNGFNSFKVVIDNYWYILHIYVIVYLFGESELRKFVKILGWSAFAVAVFTILQSLGGLNFTLHFNIGRTLKFSPPTLTEFVRIGSYPIYRGTGIIGQHLRSAAQTLMLVFFTYAAFKRKWPSAVLFVALLLSFSYSCWFGFFIAFLWYVLVRKKMFFSGVLSIAIVIAAVIYIPGSRKTIEKEFTKRGAAASSYFKILAKRPLLGIGKGQYKNIRNGHLPKLSEKISGGVWAPQSIYTNMLVDGGLLTFLAFIYFIFSLCKLYLKRQPSLKERWRDLHIAAWFALLAIFFAGFFNAFLTYAENSVFIWTLIGIIIKIKQSRWTHRLIISENRS